MKQLWYCCKRILCGVLTLTLLISFVTPLTVAAATVSAPQATVAHGYITDLKLRPSSDVEENIPGFSFTNGVASYDVTLADTNGWFILEFNVDLEQYKDLWWTVLLD